MYWQNIHPHTFIYYSYIHAYGLLCGSYTPQRGLSALTTLGQAEVRQMSHPIHKVVHNIQDACQKIEYCRNSEHTVVTQRV